MSVYRLEPSVPDDLQTYRMVAEKLEVEHQVCQFHVRRWVGQALRRLRDSVPKEWLWVLDEVGLFHSYFPILLNLTHQ